MRALRPFFAIVVLAVAAVAGWYFLRPHTPSASGETLTVYYTKLDGTTLGTWDVSLRAPTPGESADARLHDVVTYAALQSVAGPPPDISAVRFPPGTRVHDVTIVNGTALVDLRGEVASANGGAFQENGEFKGLVYTLTGIPSINAVKITIEGRTVETLPGGHLELDAPLRRSDW
ncbi:MAG TPA: GerMN domain-containing protein [Candidatus Acidoferrum sp.]|nr:GerMN domain-containing protein [Candidatus Acidoferrum sp.]